MKRAFLAFAVLTLLAAVPASAQFFYMEFQGPLTRGLPANCSMWHELYPLYCAPHHQDFIYDNGDGDLSACDQIVLDGVCYHVDWVGPTYVLDYYGQTSYWEPVDPVSGDPVCSTWHQVHPEFCTTGHVDFWEDPDGSGTVTSCDYVTIDGSIYHVVDVMLDIQVSPGSPVDPKSWGQIKSLFSTF